ncbi:uncharacterized protein LOC135379154 [Ornithodoros turicata]|uniref:uncharacterized protein LOC135379154 n=1 Tax=Ornithodoros turicata TaxID=34597 RepID=UPI003139F874
MRGGLGSDSKSSCDGICRNPVVHNQPVVVSTFEGAIAGKGVLRWGGDSTIPETTITTFEGAATSKAVARRVDDCPMPKTGISAFEGVTTTNDVAGQADSVTCGMAWETDSGGALETGIGIPQDAAEMEREPLMCIGKPVQTASCDTRRNAQRGFGVTSGMPLV